MMAKPFKGTINVDIRDSEPDWLPFEPPVAPYGAPNVVYIVLDDAGFSAMKCYGGTADPCVISWPKGMKSRGAIREQYHHAVDIVPTILDALDIQVPETIKGHTQSALDGVSMHYLNNFLGSEEQRVVGSEDIPAGEKLILSASFNKDRQEPDHATGILSIYYGDRKVGEGRIKAQLGAFAIAGSGLSVGEDPGEPITEDYPGAPPYQFTGGVIDRVAIDVSGEPYHDLEREAALMLMRE
jgi:hypothetical protein